MARNLTELELCGKRQSKMLCTLCLFCLMVARFQRDNNISHACSVWYQSFCNCRRYFFYQFLKKECIKSRLFPPSHILFLWDLEGWGRNAQYKALGIPFQCSSTFNPIWPLRNSHNSMPFAQRTVLFFLWGLYHTSCWSRLSTIFTFTHKYEKFGQHGKCHYY